MARAPRICGQVGCPNQATTTGRCDAHQREPWAGSDRRAHLPHNWATIRRRMLKRDGWLCQIRGEGCTTMATEVDHIGHRDDHTLPNLRAVCSTCHTQRTTDQATQARAEVHSRGKRPTEPHPGLAAGGG